MKLYYLRFLLEGRVNMGGATHQKDRDKLKQLGKNYNSIDKMSSHLLKQITKINANQLEL